MSDAALFEQVQGAIEAVVARILSGVHTSIPAVVESYSRGRADVQPAVSMVAPDGSGIKLPVIVDCPVIFPRTQGFSFTFPLKAGDGVLLICPESAADDYNLTGEVELQTDGRRFSLTDAVCIPGYFGGSKGMAPDDWDKITIKNSAASIVISDNGDINFNNGALKVTA